MKFALIGLLVFMAGPVLAQAESPRLRQAKKECWAEVGVTGDPNKSRGAYIHMETVTKCVRAKMGSGSRAR